METVLPYQLLNYFEQAIFITTNGLEGFGSEFKPDLRIAEPRHGDFQINGVLPWAKRQGKNPRSTGEQLAEALRKNPVFNDHVVTLEVAGPGFINLKLIEGFVLRWLQQYSSQGALQAAAHKRLEGQTIVIDYSSPNTAKQMHVGHLRSMVIGEAIQRLLRFFGANVIRDNHLGDWGTQFGILLMEIKAQQYDLDADHADALEDLERIYKEGSARFKNDPAAQQTARQELVKLQQGDSENFSLWQKITHVSYRAFEDIYRRFGVEFDQVQGESFYRDKLERVYQEMRESGIAEPSEGALVVFHREHPRFKGFPFIIQKNDGASNYGSSDLATALYHVEHAKATELVYVTDGRQQDHFAQLFLTVEKWFKAKGYPLPVMKHVWFGTVLGEDGKAIKTRTGEPIKLKDLVDEGIERAFALVSEKTPDLSEAERHEVARVVGIGALRYADLAQNRTSDYLFSWSKMLSMDGNTAPYLLYAVARIKSIFRKLAVDPNAVIQGPFASLAAETQSTLAHKLAQFPICLEHTLEDLRPHILCLYLFELASTFSSFYNAEKVMVEDTALRATRMLLAQSTLHSLELGLYLLGIETLEKM